MIAKGTYRARPLDAALGKTSTGKEQIAIMFELCDDSAQRIAWYGYFTEQTFERTVESLRHLGWQGDDLSVFGAGLPEDATQEVEIVIDHEQNQDGEWRARVRWINSGKGIAVKERLDENQARAFGAGMRGRVAALRASKGERGNGHSTPRTPAPTPPPAKTYDDDVPF
jgi:hypothetical protein